MAQTFTTKGRFLQLVFDFLSPPGAPVQLPSGAKAPRAKKARQGHGRQSNQSEGLSAPLLPSTDDAQAFVLKPSKGPWPHAQATHCVKLGGVNLHCLVKRSKRKTIALMVSHEGLEIRAPRWVSWSQVQEAICEREGWIFKQFQAIEEKRQAIKLHEIEIKDACVSQVLGHRVRWVFASAPSKRAQELGASQQVCPMGVLAKSHELKSVEGMQSVVDLTRFNTLKRLNAKRLKDPLAHLQIQSLHSGTWQDVSFHVWVQELMSSEPQSSVNHQILLPIGDLLAITKAKGMDEEEQRRCAKAWIDAFHQAVLSKVAQERVDHFAAVLGVQPKALSFGHAKHRWGSAGSNGAIRLNVQLVHVPKDLLDYVVVHELSHLREMNHSAAFWAWVAKGMPDFASHRDALKKYTMAQWV